MERGHLPVQGEDHAHLLGTHAPEILEASRKALDRAIADLNFRVLDGVYRDAPSISLDYAVAEKAGNIMRCVPLTTTWNDVGSWSALWNFMDKDSDGNVVQGEGQIILEDTRGSLAYSDHACVALVGVEDLVVVAMEDAVLVASKAHSELIKRVVDYLKGNGGDLALQHNRVYRPWGWYQSLNRGDRYQVKCIMVRPGGKLSLQSHHHRSEHWVVVTGTVEVTRGADVAMLSENQSTYIPIGEKHRLANPGKIPAFLIEVQSGAYLNEDDIVRFDDIYHEARPSRPARSPAALPVDWRHGDRVGASIPPSRRDALLCWAWPSMPCSFRGTPCRRRTRRCPGSGSRSRPNRASMTGLRLPAAR